MPTSRDSGPRSSVRLSFDATRDQASSLQIVPLFVLMLRILSTSPGVGGRRAGFLPGSPGPH